MLSAILIAAVSNLDNLSVGVAFGIRGTRISAIPNLIIAIMTMAGTAGAMTSGRALSTLIASSTAASLGSLIIIGIGLATVIGSLVAVRAPTHSPKRAPLRARRNGSALISYREALVLGVALSMNNIGSGIGAGVAGIAPFTTTLLAGAFSLLCVGGGAAAGRRLGLHVLDNRAQLASGLALVAVGTAMLSGVL